MKIVRGPEDNSPKGIRTKDSAKAIKASSTGNHTKITGTATGAPRRVVTHAAFPVPRAGPRIISKMVGAVKEVSPCQGRGRLNSQ